MASPETRPDDQLVRAFLGGDRDAFAALVERHERRVYNLAFRMLGNPEDARDTSQDVFLTCLRKLSGFRGASTFTTWLHRITVNACYDALRKRGRERLVGEDEEEFPEPPASSDLADEAALAVDIQRALLQVPEELRAEFVDGTLGPEDRARVESHLSTCASCREEVSLAGPVREALSGLPDL